jgi:hypothetical protein
MTFIAVVVVIILAAVTWIAFELRAAPLIDDDPFTRDDAPANLGWPPNIAAQPAPAGRVVITHYDCGCIDVNDERVNTCLACEVNATADDWLASLLEEGQ